MAACWIGVFIVVSIWRRRLSLIFGRICRRDLGVNPVGSLLGSEVVAESGAEPEGIPHLSAAIGLGIVDPSIRATLLLWKDPIPLGFQGNIVLRKRRRGKHEVNELAIMPDDPGQQVRRTPNKEFLRKPKTFIVKAPELAIVRESIDRDVMDRIHGLGRDFQPPSLKGETRQEVSTSPDE
jgi:hypothetical protein